MFGLARTGASAARALTLGGARVFVWDDDAHVRKDAIHAGVQPMPVSEWPWDRLRALVLSPGVPLTHPTPHQVVVVARTKGIEIVGDVELFAREIRPQRTSGPLAPIVAVTGTNGKSTTTALIGHVLSSSGYAAEVGGNIGKPVLDLSPPGPRTVYVIEVSSYQIELSPGLASDVAVLTNIAPDHLDRHGSLENYAAVKARLLEQVIESGRICIGVDDAISAAIYSRLGAQGRTDAIPISVGKVLGRGVFVLDGILYDADALHSSRVMDLRSVPRLPGAHNWQNAALAYTAVRPFVKDVRAIADAIANFPGLAHRLEDVGRIANVRFVNDSKATNADAAERALLCFEDIFWIAGGRQKEGGIGSLAEHLSRVRKAYLIGEAAQEFSKTLGAVPQEICGTLDKAIAAAYRDARRSNSSSPVVLLSPACASFDQFKNYEERGDVFRSLVKELASQPVREAS